ncbi:MAG: hypothetical protein KME64_28650 [Scytonematopsis contorta HA4267-MV1]|nr:hypothetical protein [Scytonematopsis contorta HA4267-MV1]
MIIKMDNQKEQHYSVSNPLDLLLDSEYMKQAIADETSVGGSIGAGLDWGPNIGKLLFDVTLLGRLTTLRISLNKEARLTIEALNLGEKTKLISRAARERIKEKLLFPTPTAIPHIKSVLERDNLYDAQYISDREILKFLLKVILTDHDREIIAEGGSNSERFQIIAELCFDEVVSQL